MSTPSSPLPWGILGTGFIATTFVKDLNQHFKGSSSVAAVLSRDPHKAQAFGNEHGIPSDQCFHDMDEFLKSGIKVCYIASPHTLHTSHAISCLNAGVAVLVEKPLALNAEDARRVFQVARKAGLFAMEAIWTRFLPAMEEVRRRIIVEGEIGQLLSIDTDFGFHGIGGAPRLMDPELGGGSLSDLAPYSLHLPSLLLGDSYERMPEIRHVECTMQNGVDTTCRAFLVYKNCKDDRDVHLTFRTTIREDTSCVAVIRGDKGICVIKRPFYCPEEFIMGEKQEKVEKVGHGLHYEVQEVEKCINSGLLESSMMTWDESISWATILEALCNRRS